MSPEQYDAWYHTSRGRWTGDAEWALLRTALEPAVGDSILDVGCGTGWFTRRAVDNGAFVTGLDIDEAALSFARRQGPANVRLVLGDATRLPFGDRTFDRVMSVTALCFVDDWSRALEEIVRVTRLRFAVGLLNRNSLLWLQKGRRGGTGAYSGAHWHTKTELDAAMEGITAYDMIRIRVRQVGYALLFDQMACARRHLQQPRDDLIAQAHELIASEGTRHIENGFTLGV